MKEEKAIKYLQSKSIKSFGNVRESYDIAILALKKQIPSKIQHPIDINGEENKSVSYCYQCGQCVKDQLYCHKCGQKLNWGNLLNI